MDQSPVQLLLGEEPAQLVRKVLGALQVFAKRFFHHQAQPRALCVWQVGAVFLDALGNLFKTEAVVKGTRPQQISLFEFVAALQRP